MKSTRKPISLGGTVARGDDRAKQATAPASEPEPPPREATRTTTVRVPESLHRKLQHYCVDNETTIQEVVIDLLRDLLERTK